MLRYFFTRKILPSVETPEATNFDLLSAKEFKNKTIPFSHIYVTSEPYLKLIKKSLGDEHQESIVNVSKQQSVLIEQQDNFPINISHFKVDSAKDLHNLFGNKHHINIGVVNGIGLSFSDNLVGLGIIQRLAKLLAPATVTVHLMQSLNRRFTQIYTDKVDTTNLKVKIHNNCTSVDNFFKLDGYVDLTGKMGYEEYSEMSLASFYATAFSIENLISSNNIQPKIITNDSKTNYYKGTLNQHFSEKRPVVLFHPEAADLLRNCSIDVAKKLINEVIKQNYNILSNFKYSDDNQHYLDYTEIAKNLDDLVHLITACDAIITIGSLTYHLAAALGKPTILLPTVKSDIRNTASMPEVLQWLPKDSQHLYLNKDEDNKQFLDKIWNNIDINRVAKTITPFINQFNKNGDRSVRIGKTEKIGIIILGNNKDKNLTDSIDQLINIPEVDPLWIYMAEAKNSATCSTLNINESIEQAIDDHCEYIWIIDNDIKPEINYLQQGLELFSKDKEIGIMTGAIHDNKQIENIVKAGGDKFFPKSTYQSGPAANYKLQKTSRQLWVDFESTILKTEMLTNIGVLDEKFDVEYKEIDLCLRAILNNWSIYYKPECKSYKTNEPRSEQGFNFNSDIQVFFKKWGSKVKCNDINNLDIAIRKHIRKYLLNNMTQKNNLRF